MKIFNIMLSKDLGGVQQVFLDHYQALPQVKIAEGAIEIINITSFRALINKAVPSIKLPNLGNWDIFSRLYLKILIFMLKPQIIVAHGSRAIILAHKLGVPVVGIAHGSVKHLDKCDYIVALTDYMKSYLLEQNFAAEKIIMLPNMIQLKKAYQPRKFRSPIIIGTIARFVDKKNIDIFLHSLAILKQQNIKFKALVGGDGEQAKNLQKLCLNLGLEQQVQFLGWVTDRDKFFADIDIFCVPSKLEPFGLVVLESFAQSTPVVATASEGPREIIRDNLDGLLCKIDDPIDLAEKIKFMINNSALASGYAKSGYQRLNQNYKSEIVAKNLTSFFRKVAYKWIY